MTMLIALLVLFALSILVGQSIRASKTTRSVTTIMLAVLQTILMLLYLLTMEAPEV